MRLLVGKNPRVTLLRAAALAVVCVVVGKFVLLPVRVNGDSMLPTYRNRQINAVNALAYRWRSPRRGDVVTIRTSGRRIMFMKRLIGLPTERLEIRDGQVYINDEPLAEPYVAYNARWDYPEIQLDADQYFAVGDNRGVAIERHQLGRVARDRIVGKVLW